MHATDFLPGRWRAGAAVVAGLAAVLMLALACGSEAGGSLAGAEAGFQKVAPSARTYTIDDLLAFGFRTSKEYNVEGLPGAVEAWYGFWGPDPYSRKDYEVRFYASHEDAVNVGFEPADQVTGTEDLMANKDTLEWRGGWKEWWFRASGIMTFSDVMGKHNVAKYGDFVILGNMVVLCEGEDSGQSLERCRALIDALRESGAGG
ncbi:MAG: hypothetical protein FJ313_03720 [Gemmatimonadetes bacterium]|nr:hypothetical protein [Gemmatimonadota bacterium]